MTNRIDWVSIDPTKSYPDGDALAGPPLAESPKVLADLVLSEWQRSRWQGPGSQGFPSGIAALNRILDTAFQASLQREEGRPVRFRLAYGDTPYPAGQAYRLRASPFSRLRTFSASEIRRLAPATEPQRTAIGVAPFRALSSSTTQLLIWGLLVSEDGFWGHDQLLFDHLLEADFTVASRRSGELEVALAGWAVARLTGGRVSRVELAIPRIIGDWLREIGRGDDVDRPWALRGPYLQLLTEIAAGMRRGEHGGMVAIAESPAVVGTLLEYIDLKYRFRRVGRGPRYPYLDLAEPAEGKATRQDRTRRVKDVVDLTLVDGAVVLDDALSVIGFGGVVGTPSLGGQSLREAVATDSLIRRDPEAFGTRHKAAFGLCQLAPGTHVVICSQDGDVKLVRRIGEHVVYWEMPLS